MRRQSDSYLRMIPPLQDQAQSAWYYYGSDVISAGLHCAEEVDPKHEKERKTNAMEYRVKRRNATEPRSNIIVDDVDDDEEVQPRRTPPTPPASVRSGGVGGNPALVINLRKLARMTGGTMADVAVGFLIGVLSILFILFLDHHDVIELGHSRAIRRSAIRYISKPENVASIEESMDIKLVSLDEYSALIEEIAQNLKEARTKEGYLEGKRVELEGPMVQYEELMAPYRSLKLDKWCGTCQGKTWNCDSRLEYLKSTYKTSYVRGKVDIMKGGYCILP